MQAVLRRVEGVVFCCRVEGVFSEFGWRTTEKKEKKDGHLKEMFSLLLQVGKVFFSHEISEVT